MSSTRTKHTFTPHTKDHLWSDGMNAGLLAPVSKGRVIIVRSLHTNIENGFIPNALLNV